MRNRETVALLLLVIWVSAFAPHVARALVFSFSTSLPNPDPNENVFSKLLQLQNGTVWMVWEKVTPTMAGDIYFMGNNGFGWGGSSAIVSGMYDDISPSLVQLNNGTVMLVWSRGTVGNFNSYSIYTRSYTNGKWSSVTPLVISLSSNFDPVLVKASDGAVWMVWSRSSATNGNGDLYYKIFRNNVWGPEAPIPTASSFLYEEKLPSVAQTADGKIWIVYESNPTGTAQLYYTKYTGSSWTSSVPLTGSVYTDKWPSITQDRNGTLWVFWARELPNGTSPPPNPSPQYQWDVFYKSSYNNGTSWTNDFNFSGDINADEQHPTVFQGPDKQLWIIYDSCCNSPGNPYGTPNLFIAKSNVIPAHDLAITTIAATPAPEPRLRENVTLSVTISDPGAYTETSTLVFYVNSTLVGTATVIISAGSSQLYTFVWSSSGRAPGKYSTMAIITTVSRELVTQNNRLNSTFSLTFRGDLNRDGQVTIVDLSNIATRFGALLGSANYDETADLNNDNKINLFDLTICSLDFGKSLP